MISFKVTCKAIKIIAWKVNKMDPGILCFHHCEHKVFCTVIPDHCPVCQQELDRYDYTLLPFRYVTFETILSYNLLHVGIFMCTDHSLASNWKSL